MRNYSKKKKFNPNPIATTQRQFIQGIVFLICMSLVIIFIFGDHGLIKLYKIKNQRKKVQNHIAQLRQEKEKKDPNLNYIVVPF